MHTNASIGPYRVVRELGRGGMGVVYEVRHPARPGRLALKLILAGAADAEALARFGREAELLARLRHPGVVAVHDLGRAPQGPYLVMDLVEGQPLDETLRAGSLGAREAAGIVRDLADAVEALHRAGVLHRDLKPGNVILRADSGRPVLLDFGIARSVDLERLTQTGSLVGSPEYMAPEQAEGLSSTALGPPTDVYGLGAVLFSLLAGRPPFPARGVSLLKVLRAVIEDEPPWPEAPGPLLAVLRRALAKEAAARYPSAAALRDDLDAVLSGRPPSAAPGARVPRRGLLLAGALALPALLAALVLFALPGGRGRERGQGAGELPSSGGSSGAGGDAAPNRGTGSTEPVAIAPSALQPPAVLLLPSGPPPTGGSSSEATPTQATPCGPAGGVLVWRWRTRALWWWCAAGELQRLASARPATWIAASSSEETALVVSLPEQNGARARSRPRQRGQAVVVNTGNLFRLLRGESGALELSPFGETAKWSNLLLDAAPPPRFLTPSAGRRTLALRPATTPLARVGLTKETEGPTGETRLVLDGVLPPVEGRRWKLPAVRLALAKSPPPRLCEFAGRTVLAVVDTELREGDKGSPAGAGAVKAWQEAPRLVLWELPGDAVRPSAVRPRAKARVPGPPAVVALSEHGAWCAVLGPARSYFERRTEAPAWVRVYRTPSLEHAGGAQLPAAGLALVARDRGRWVALTASALVFGGPEEEPRRLPWPEDGRPLCDLALRGETLFVAGRERVERWSLASLEAAARQPSLRKRLWALRREAPATAAPQAR
ncbi:MAG: serine/threonine protein kinase [Planctomycetota bacterium]|nr:MAG: serine/threonine protein kinase [Planctomycetota bacterium]